MEEEEEDLGGVLTVAAFILFIIAKSGGDGAAAVQIMSFRICARLRAKNGWKEVWMLCCERLPLFALFKK